MKWLLAERTNRLCEQLAEAIGSREVADSCEADERAAIEQNIGLACGLELKLSLAAVDVANAARAVLHAEKRKTAIVGRIVVLADAYHVFEARLTNFVGAYLVVGELGFAFHNNPALAGFPPGKLELGIRLKLEPNVFVA